MKKIFIGGVHGSGKTTLAQKLSLNLGVDVYSAGELIEKGCHVSFGNDRRVDKNVQQQEILIEQVSKIIADSDRDFLLVGHFCLVDKNKKIYRIPNEIFMKLSFDKIIIMMEEADILKSRNDGRKSLDATEKFYTDFQKEELNYAREIADQKSVPILITTSENFVGVCQFIEE